MYDSNLTEKFIGSFTIDLMKFAIRSKIYFASRLVRLLEYIKHKKIRQDAVQPITDILNEMKRSLRVDQMNNSVIKSKIYEEIVKEEDQEAMEEKGEIVRLLEQSLASFDVKNAKINKRKVVILPKYHTSLTGEVDYMREIEIPNPDYYVCLGYFSKASEESKKHYRLALNDTLESSEYVSSGNYETSPVFRGKKIPSEQSFLASIFFKEEQYKEVGLFRGSIKLIQEKYLADIFNLDMPNECQKLQLPASMEDWANSKTDKRVAIEQKVRIFVYIVDAKLFEDADPDSASDPYIKIQLGEKLIDVRLA